MRKAARWPVRSVPKRSLGAPPDLPSQRSGDGLSARLGFPPRVQLSPGVDWAVVALPAWHASPWAYPPNYRCKPIMGRMPFSDRNYASHHLTNNNVEQ